MATILIADDESSVRRIVCRIVEKLGHTSVEASNGKEAWEKFQGQPIDLSIVDVRMPEMDGIGYLERVKQTDPHAVVIVMTGFPSAETIIETIEDDGYTYITKPLQVDQIEDLVNRGLACREERLKGKWS